MMGMTRTMRSRTSPAAKASPSFLHHSTIDPSCMKGDIAGIMMALCTPAGGRPVPISVDVDAGRAATPTLAHGRDGDEAATSDERRRREAPFKELVRARELKERETATDMLALACNTGDGCCGGDYIGLAGCLYVVEGGVGDGLRCLGGNELGGNIEGAPIHDRVLISPRSQKRTSHQMRGNRGVGTLRQALRTWV